MRIILKNVIYQGKKTDIFIEKNLLKKIGHNLDKKIDEKIDCKGQKAVLPGLINCHTHSAMSLFRGYADDMPLKDWLEKKIWPLEAKLNAEDVYWGTKLACLEMLKTGTTCFNDMYWFEDASVEAVKEMGIRAKIGLVLLDNLPMGSKENIKKLFQKLRTNHLKTIKLCIAPHSIYTVSRQNLIWAKDFAQKNNLSLHIHLSETEKEVKDCLRKYKMRPVEYLDKIGFLGKNTILAHSIWLSDKEIEILAKRKCSVVYCPCSNMKLGSGIFPYRKLKKAGVNICLGTDGPASNNNLDMFEEMKFAGLLQPASANEIFEIAAGEINPVEEFRQGFPKKNLKSRSESKFLYGVKQGRLADLILVDLNHVCLCPGHNLISDLVYSCNGDYVSDVICNGKILMRDRKIKGEEKIKTEAKKRAKRLTKLLC